MAAFSVCSYRGRLPDLQGHKGEIDSQVICCLSVNNPVLASSLSLKGPITVGDQRFLFILALSTWLYFL